MNHSAFHRAARIFAIVLSLSLLLASLAGCHKQEESQVSSEESSLQEVESSQASSQASSEVSSEASSEESSQASSEAAEESSTVEVDPLYLNPLTGEVMDGPYANDRPVAFMINNIWVAVPQCGIADADIFYEANVESGITRLMVFYQHIPDDTIVGSVRSLRHSYIDFAKPFDAIIAHCGGSNIADEQVKTRHVDDIEAISWAGDLFYRDAWRQENMGYEHSLMTTGQAINDYLENDTSYRTQHEEDYDPSFMTFSDDPKVSGGEVKSEADVDFGLGKHTIFTYDPSTNDYTMTEYDDPWIDDNTDEPVHIKNVVVVQTDVWTMSDGVHKDMTLTGTGSGYFMVNGVMAPITWSRDDEDGPFTYTYADGTPVVFGVGKTYVCVIAQSGGVS